MTNLYFYSSQGEPIATELYRQVKAMKCSKIKIWVDEPSPDRFKAIGRDVEIMPPVNVTSSDINYYEWRVDTCSVLPVADSGRKTLLRHVVDNNEDFAVVCTEKRAKNFMMAFDDAIQNADLPNQFVKVPWLSTWNDVEAFCSRRGVFAFDLDDTKKYKKVKGYSPQTRGAVVYQEIATGNYIHLDTLHKDHYEVYEPRGSHIGEMDLEGQLDRSKADPRKHLER